MNLLEQLIRENQEVSKKKGLRKFKESTGFEYDATSEEDQRLFDWIGQVVAPVVEDDLKINLDPSDYDLNFEMNQLMDEVIDLLVQMYKMQKSANGTVTEGKKSGKSKKAVKESVSFVKAIKDYMDDSSMLHNNQDRDQFEKDWGSEIEDILMKYEDDFDREGFWIESDPKPEDLARVISKEDQDKIVQVYKSRFKVNESKKVVKEGITPDNYKIYRTTIDFATDGTRPVAKPGSPFENAIYKALEDLGYIVMNDSYSFDFEDVTDIYPVEDLEDWMFEDN